jgi:hypothetical protein
MSTSVAKHPRIAKFAAFAATAGVVGSAGFAVSAASFAKAADTAKPAHGTNVQLDAFLSPVKPAAAKPAPAKPAPAKPAPAKPAAAKAAKHNAAPTKPYPIYDSVEPGALPHGKVAAVYANGAYQASGHQVKDAKSVLWIDTNGSNPGANVLDVEPGDATPHGAAVWVQQRLDKHPDSVAIVYTMRSSWQDVKDNMAHLPKWQQDKVRYWIADPTGVQHMVPGADATQWYWGAHIDISVANPSLTQAR